MRALPGLVLAAMLLTAPAARACEAVADVGVLLADDAEDIPSGRLLLPQHWAPGDPAVALTAPAAFRAGCADPAVATLLEAGLAVLLMGPPQGSELARVALGIGALRDGFGAGAVAALWPAGPPAACAAVFATLLAPEGAERACRAAPR